MDIFPKYDILGKAMLAQSIFPVMAWLKTKNKKDRFLIEPLQITILLWKVRILNNISEFKRQAMGRSVRKLYHLKRFYFPLQSKGNQTVTVYRYTEEEKASFYIQKI